MAEFTQYRGKIVGLIEGGQAIYGYLFDDTDKYYVLDKPVLLKVKEQVGFFDYLAVSSTTADIFAELLTSVAEGIINNNSAFVRSSKEQWIQAFRNQLMNVSQQGAVPMPLNIAPIIVGVKNEGPAGKNIAYFPKDKFIFIPHEDMLLSAADNEDNKKAVEEIRKIIEDTYDPKKLEQYKKWLAQLQENEEKLRNQFKFSKEEFTEKEDN